MNQVFFNVVLNANGKYIHIKRCMDTIMQQTFKDFIVTFICDNEKDESYAICKIYQKRNYNVFISNDNTYTDYCFNSRYMLDLNIDQQYDCDFLERVKEVLTTENISTTRLSHKQLGFLLSSYNSQNAIVWCVDSDMNSNIMMMQSLFSFANFNKTQKYIVITEQNNPFVFYFNKIPWINIVYCDDFIAVNLQDKKFNDTDSHLSLCVFYRLMLFDKSTVFGNFRKILYVDNDTVCTKDISNIFDYANDNPIAMVEEKLLSWGKDLLNKQLLEKTISAKIEKYFNAGVFLINTEIIAENDMTECIKMIEYNFRLNDQDILNLKYKDKIQELPEIFNGFFGTSKCPNDCAIIHLCSGVKYDSEDIFSKNYKRYVLNERL